MGEAVQSGKVEINSEAGDARGEEAVGWNLELGGDVENRGAEEVEDEGADDGGLGDGEEGVVDERVVELEEAQDESLVVG